MELPFVSKKKYNEVVSKLERLLCHATGGKLSKHTYTLQVMESAVTDYIQDCCDDASEPRHSRWKLIVPSWGDSATIICGECGRERTIREERRDFISVLPIYCDKCGACMDSKIEIEEEE